MIDLEIINIPDPILTGFDLFMSKRVVLFGLPGAFTPTCSSKQLPGFEKNYAKIKKLGIDEVYCTSVNDGFVMKEWFKAQEIKKVKFLADGNGVIADAVGMLVEKTNLGFGMRSWRYAAVIRNGQVEAMFAEEGVVDNAETDPYEASTPENILKYLKEND